MVTLAPKQGENLDVTGSSPVLQDLIDHVKVLHSLREAGQSKGKFIFFYIYLCHPFEGAWFVEPSHLWMGWCIINLFHDFA